MSDEQPVIPADEAEVLPNLRGRFRELKGLIRGNNKRDKQLQVQHNKQLDLGIVLLARLDAFIEHTMGTPQQSEERLEFEVNYATGIRKMYDSALAEERRDQLQKPL